MSIDAEDRLSELLHATTFDPPTDINAADVRRRAGRQRRRLASIGAAAAIVLVVATIGTSGYLRGSGTSSVGVDNRATGFQSVLGVTGNGQIVIETPGSKAAATGIAHGSLDHAPAYIASNPTGGWVTTFYRNGVERVGLVGGNGLLRPFGPTFVSPHEVITGLAVSPNGAELAIATAQSDGAAAAQIQVIATPFHHAVGRSWTTPTPAANVIESLAWSPDGSELAYVAGSATGHQAQGVPSFLNVSAPGSTAQLTSRWDPDRLEQCAFNAIGWVGGQDQLGVIDHCGGTPGEQFQLVNPNTGEPIGASAQLAPANPHALLTDCSGDLQSAGGTTLVTWCQQVYRVTGGVAQRVPGDLVDAAPPGQPVTS